MRTVQRTLALLIILGGLASAPAVAQSQPPNNYGPGELISAGHQFFGWQKPHVLTRVTYFYVDPRGPLLDPELRFAETEFKPLGTVATTRQAMPSNGPRFITLSRTCARIPRSRSAFSSFAMKTSAGSRNRC